MAIQVVSFSGGMDSTTLLRYVLWRHEAKEVLAVSFFYASKHGKYETEAAASIARELGVDHITIDVEAMFRVITVPTECALMLDSEKEIPEGHYEAETMKQTVVPGRNTVFTSILFAICQSYGGGGVWLGIHSGDHEIYPDCRPDWAHGMRNAMNCASEGYVMLKTPFLDMNKADILREGYKFTDPITPYHLTRTCYKDQEVACGKCGSCQERLEAFQAINRNDPIPYNNRVLFPKEK